MLSLSIAKSFTIRLVLSLVVSIHWFVALGWLHFWHLNTTFFGWSFIIAESVVRICYLNIYARSCMHVKSAPYLFSRFCPSAEPKLEGLICRERLSSGSGIICWILNFAFKILHLTHWIEFVPTVCNLLLEFVPAAVSANWNFCEENGSMNSLSLFHVCNFFI